MDKETLISEVAHINALTPREARTFVGLVGLHPELVDGSKVVVRARNGVVISRLTWPSDPAEEEGHPSISLAMHA